MMRKIMSKPKYDGYEVKCWSCRCKFFASFEDVDVCGYDDMEYVMCPSCNHRLYHSLFWKKHRGDK